MCRTTLLMTRVMAALLAVMAPGAPVHGRKQSAEPTAALVAQGHTLFVTNCSPCHGADAQGDDGPNLHHKGFNDAVIAHAVKTGFKGEMPSFDIKFKAPEVKALVAYIHSLQ